MDFHIQRLQDADAIEALTAEWELLERAVYPRTPFTSPLWAALWWKHLRQQRNFRRHEFFVHALRDHNNRLVAILPLVIAHQPAHGPLRLRVLQFFGASDGSVTEHRRVICRPEDEAAVVAAFTHYLLELRSNWDLFLWTGIRAADIGRNKPYGALKAYRAIPEYVVTLPASWEIFRSSLSRNMREKIRKSYKLLSRDGHAFAFRAVERPLEIPAAIERFLALHTARSQLGSGPKHRDYFSAVSHRKFIADCALQMAQRGQFLIFELDIEGNVVASRLAFIFDGEAYFYYSGFDSSWSKHSVMTTLMCESFKWLIGRGVAIANMSTGRDLSKLRWNPHEIVFHDTVLVSPTLRGRVAHLAFPHLIKTASIWPLREGKTKPILGDQSQGKSA